MTRISRVVLICCASYAATVGFFLWNNFTGSCCSGPFGLPQIFAKFPCNSCSVYEHLRSDRFNSVLTLLAGITLALILNRIPEKFPTIAENYFFKKQQSAQTSHMGKLSALFIVFATLMESYLIVNVLHPPPKSSSIEVYPESIHVTEALPNREYINIDVRYTERDGSSFRTDYWTEFSTRSGTSNVIDISTASSQQVMIVGNGDDEIIVRAGDLEKRIPVSVRSSNQRPLFVKQPGCAFLGSPENACRVQLRVGEVVEIPFTVKDDDGDKLFIELWPRGRERDKDYVEPIFVDQNTPAPRLKLKGIKPTEQYLAFSLVALDNRAPEGSSQSSFFIVTVLP